MPCKHPPDETKGESIRAVFPAAFQDPSIRAGRNYGLVLRYRDQAPIQAVPGARVAALSQEHGTIHANNKLIESLSHGDILGIIPVHSCLAANLLRDHFMIV